jgi:hypothetical protein
MMLALGMTGTLRAQQGVAPSEREGVRRAVLD